MKGTCEPCATLLPGFYDSYDLRRVFTCFHENETGGIGYNQGC